MGRTCSACSMGPPTERYYSGSPAIVNQKSIEIDQEVGGWGPNQARMCVCVHTRIDLGVAQGDGRVGWAWHKARRWWRDRWPVDGGGWQPQVVVMTQNRCTCVRNIEKSIKFDEK